MRRRPPKDRLSAPLVALLGLALAACSGSDATTAFEWHASYDTIGDTAIVRTESGGEWGEPAELVEDMRIGQFDGPDEYMFGRIRSLAVGPDGSIYAFDSHSQELRKYAPDGTYVATFGREGGGPGEYKRPDGGLAVLSDGRVLLRDPANNRISAYSPDGEYLDGWRIRGGFNTSRPLHRDLDDNVYTLILLDTEASVTEWAFGLVQYRPDGSAGDTVAAPTWDYKEPELVATHTDGDNQSMSVNGVPFSPSASWLFSPLGYMVGGLSTRYAVDLHIAGDRVLRIERGDWEPVPVNPSEREEQERIMTANMRQTQPNWKWNGPPIPDTKPPFKGLLAGERGRIWVVLYQDAHQIELEDETAGEDRPGHVPEATWVESTAFDVFEPDGRYLGMVRAPDGFARYPYPVIRGDTVWAVVRGEFDVPYIVRFHVDHGGIEATH